MSPRSKGILCILASAAGFAAMAACVRLADGLGAPLPAIEKSFFRNLAAFALALPVFLKADDRWRLVRGARRSLGLLVARSVFGTLGVFGNFYAISRIPLGDASMLNKLAPFFTVLFSRIFLGERIRRIQTLAVVGAFLGSLCVVRPTFAFGEALPALAGFGSGVAAGSAYACVRALAIRRVDARVIILFFSAFSTLAAVPFMAADFRPMNAAQFATLLAAGGAAAVGQFGITCAYRFAAPRSLACFDYANVPFAALFGFALFGQVPDALSCLGFAIIVAMALTMRFAGDRGK